MFRDASVAQLDERIDSNDEGTGSSPVRGTAL